MNIKKLNVLGMQVIVRIKKLNPVDKSVAEYDPNTKTITIDPTYSDLSLSYFHECGHALYQRSGMQQAVRNGPIEEVFCEAFSNFMEDNIVFMYQNYLKLKKIDKKI